MKPPKSNETLETGTNHSRSKQILIYWSLQLTSGNAHVLQHTYIYLQHSFCYHFAAQGSTQPEMLPQCSQAACHSYFEDNVRGEDSTDNLKQGAAEPVVSGFQLQIKFSGKICFKAALNENLYN